MSSRRAKRLARIGNGLERQVGEKSRDLELETKHSRAMLEALIKIGMALSQEKNHDELLKKILILSKRTTGADAGSIFTVETDAHGAKSLLFRRSHTFSKDLQYERKEMAIDLGSIAGYVATTGKSLNIADVRDLDPDAPFEFNAELDRQHGYRTVSMLVVPMRNYWDEIIGVIELINCVEGAAADEIDDGALPEDPPRIVPFDPRYESMVAAIASLSAISLENNRMIRQIEEQFEQFVRAAVAAIESRDPATSGHSLRVARMCVNTARAVDECSTGPFADVRFGTAELKELEMAALLHDFGKLYIEPGLLMKARKLFPGELAHLMLRLEYIYRTLQVSSGAALSQDVSRRLEALLSVMRMIEELDEPAVVDRDPRSSLADIRSLEPELQCRDLKGQVVPLLTDAEVESLEVRRGTLNRSERAMLERHVEHSFLFARKIPWPTEFERIPEIVRCHHERLNGSGYPRKLQGDTCIPLQSRIMTIADVFDALSAADRPYKKAVARERVFEILREEAGRGELDAELVELFIRSEAYR